jgi:hypothetical protein
MPIGTRISSTRDRAPAGSRRCRQNPAGTCELRHIVTKRLRNVGSANTPNWECDYCPYTPDDRTLVILLTGTVQDGAFRRELPGAGLLARVPKA